MKINVYSLYDSAAKAFTTPMHMPNDGLAIRAFMDNVNGDKANNNIARHPEQFTLFKIGEFDDSIGQLIELKPKKELGVGVAFIDDNTKQYSNVDMETLYDELANISKKIQEIEEKQWTIAELEDSGHLPSLLKEQTA